MIGFIRSVRMFSVSVVVTLSAVVLLGAGAANAQNWTGDGGKGTSLTIFAPQAVGLTENQSHLPTVIQAEFVNNFSGYSAISVLDWERLDGIYLKLFEEKFDDNAEARQDLGRLTPTTHFMDGKITKTPTGYHLQVSIIKTSDKMTSASYTGTFTFWELDNLTGIRRASLELLQKMGVTLTAGAQGKLRGAAAENHVSAQNAFAKGITAQRQGTEVAALSYYFQAAAYDPSMKVAVNRSSVLSANISGGNIGDNVRNDIAWRKAWVERLAETERYFDNFNKMESMPYTLFYSDDIKQGAVNYQTETVAMSVETHLHGSGIWTLSIERALQVVYDGLNATGRKDTWGLGRWPQQGVTELNAFAERRNNLSVGFELLNNQNKVIGKETLQVGGSWQLNWSGRPEVRVYADKRETLEFKNVDANSITDKLTIRATSVNGIGAEDAAISGVLQIRALGKKAFDRNASFTFERGELKGFVNNRNDSVVNLVIPSTIWGDPVISIGDGAFSGSYGSTKLTSVTIPSGVISIGKSAFRDNWLNRVTMPSGVTSIGTDVFRPTFLDFYNQNGKKAGTYIHTAKGWRYYGSVGSAAAAQIPKIVLDIRDGQSYHTVKIGNKTWMAENLNYGEHCYDNNKSYCDKYGSLYNWDEANKACPAGWHSSTRADWEELLAMAGGQRGAGKKLMSATWNKKSTDDYGFSALPGGRYENARDGTGAFIGYTSYLDGFWWSPNNTKYYEKYVVSMRLGSNDVYMRLNTHAEPRYSIRCVQD